MSASISDAKIDLVDEILPLPRQQEVIIRSQTADLPDCKLHYLTAGRGPALILLTGREGLLGVAKTQLFMPVLSISGEKSSGDFLGRQVNLVATNAKAVILKDAGHWVLEERPNETIDALIEFL